MHQPLCFPWEKKTKGAFSYLLASGVIVTKVCVRQTCLGKLSPLSSDAQVGFSQKKRNWYRNCLFLLHLLLLRETRPILDLQMLQMQLRVSKQCMNAHDFISVTGKIIDQGIDKL